MRSVLKVPFSNPAPDFDELTSVVKGEKKAERVHFVELGIDPEIVNHILEEFLDEKPVKSPLDEFETFYRQRIEFWYRMGYDYIRVAGGLDFPRAKHKQAEDTALLSRGARSWIDEGSGVISSWKDFEEYPWPKPESIVFSHYEFVSKNLPGGMKMMVCPSSGVFEICSEELLGFEGMSYLIHDDPNLVEAVFNRVGELIYEFYKNLVTLEGVGGFFQGDDLGFKTSTIISPALLRKLVLPWHKKFAALAHKHNKMYWLHSCGNLVEIEKDLINDVQIDALHSFQDAIMPVVEFKKRCGDQVAALGGVDMDRLCRSDEEELRRYVREILKNCMPIRYALGSGNTVANYVPVKNYLIMLDEGARWIR
ncbi:MAG: uroporphyrinogen-III decarboxylase-like protein [Firmicutes bacterium]|nr:uroporphyrinogen-III decarboxylase-like protein [Bacillota bacterium]